MTGWRLGTLMAPAPIAKAVASLQSQTTSNATTFAQFGALAAMQQWDASMAAVQTMLKVLIAVDYGFWRAYSRFLGFNAPALKERFTCFPSLATLA